MRDKIKYLSISNDPYKISYSVFNGKVLEYIGFRTIDYKISSGIVLLDIEDSIKNLITKYDVDIVVMSEIDLTKYTKKDIVKMVEYKTIIQLTSLNNGCLYSEFKSDGWKQRLTFTKNLTNIQKVKIVNYGYDLNLTKKDSGIADSIILGEAVAHNKLHIGR